MALGLPFMDSGSGSGLTIACEAVVKPIMKIETNLNVYNPQAILISTPATLTEKQVQAEIVVDSRTFEGTSFQTSLLAISNTTINEVTTIGNVYETAPVISNYNISGAATVLPTTELGVAVSGYALELIYEQDFKMASCIIKAPPYNAMSLYVDNSSHFVTTDLVVVDVDFATASVALTADLKIGSSNEIALSSSVSKNTINASVPVLSEVTSIELASPIQIFPIDYQPTWNMSSEIIKEDLSKGIEYSIATNANSLSVAIEAEIFDSEKTKYLSVQRSSVRKQKVTLIAGIQNYLQVEVSLTDEDRIPKIKDSLIPQLKEFFGTNYGKAISYIRGQNPENGKIFEYIYSEDPGYETTDESVNNFELMYFSTEQKLKPVIIYVEYGLSTDSTLEIEI